MTELELDQRPTRLGISLSVLFAIVTVLVVAVVPLSLVPGLLGLILLTSGTVRGTGSLVTVGACGLGIAILVAGLGGTDPVLLLVGTAGTVLAWDAGIQAIDLGTMLGREANTSRALVVHVAASTIIAAMIAGIGYAVFHIVSGGQPVTALVLLLFGALILVAAFRG
jgi:hypothetical protein